MAGDIHRFGRSEAPVRLAPLLLAALGGVALLLALAPRAHAQYVAGTSIYVRQDSDHTTVIAPRWHVGAPVGETTHLDFTYTTDVWTSASVDIRASASKPITEQRDEMDASISHEWTDLTLNASYRYSHEYDYVSHGGTLGGSFSFADKDATLDFRVAGAFDVAGRAGDPHFAKPVRNLSGRIGFTQVFDSQMFGQIVYELMNAHGYNSSAYRFVGIGSPDALCHQSVAQLTATGVLANPEGVQSCIPEASPNERMRHAIALHLRRALGEHVAADVGYRFYIDSWDVVSHTILGELSYSVDPSLIFALRYRFYVQTAASHYLPFYDVSDSSRQYYTNDKELSAFHSQRLALDIEKIFDLDARGRKLDVVLSVAPSLFQYSNYVPLNQITALEVTLSTVFTL